ncbi:MAG: TonB-dependent receptor [Pseudomonadota bacterium]
MLFALTPSTFAQEQDDGFIGLEEITITAQRRAEGLQNVPIPVSAFTENELKLRGINRALDLVNFVPNLFGLNNTGLGSANAYYLRGLGNTESIATFDPPIGTYVDDIYLSRQNANNLSFFDIERVEVLRGPQGTLFGRNTTGGAISVVFAEPGEEFGGYAEAGYGAFDRVLLRGSVDVPVNEDVAFKISAYLDDDGGYAKNTVTNEDLNDNDSWGVRLGARANINEVVSWTGSYMYVEANGENILNFECDPANPTDCDGRFISTGFSEEGGALEGLLTGDKQFYGNSNNTGQHIITSNFELEFDTFNVNFITGYVDLSQQFALDFGDGRTGLPTLATPVPDVPGTPWATGLFTIANDSTHEQFTQEIKVNGSFGDGAIDYVAGIFYFDETNVTDFGDVFTIGLNLATFMPAPGGFPLVLADRVLTNTTEAWAGYAQADWNATEQLKLTVGLRYTDETKTFAVRDNSASCTDGTIEATCLDTSNLVASNGVAIPTSVNEGVLTPRFAASYQLTDDALVFASATRGFKSGGWNARGTSPDTLLPFGPEKVWSYEVGGKTEWLDRRLRVNLTAYYLDVSGLQTPSALTADDGSVTFLTRNFADYENYGVELEITAVPVPGLNVFFNLGYQQDEYKIGDTTAQDEFGFESTFTTQQNCIAELATGAVAGPIPDALGGRESPNCGIGIVSADGQLSEPVRTPDWSLAFGASYDYPIGNTSLFVTPSVNATYRSSSETGTSNVTLFDAPVTSALTGATFPANIDGNGDVISGSFSPSFWFVNANISLRDEDNGWTIVAECNNCFDEAAVQSSLVEYSYISPPRTWMVRGRFDF